MMEEALDNISKVLQCLRLRVGDPLKPRLVRDGWMGGWVDGVQVQHVSNEPT